MKIKSILTGIIAMVIIATIFYISEFNSREINVPEQQEPLLIIEDSILENLSDAEIQQLQAFSVRAMAAAEKPAIYSPHAKYLDNGAILAYMMFVNKSPQTITELHSLTVKMIDRDNRTIAAGLFPGAIYNMPPVAPNNMFLFALILNGDSVRIADADLSSYTTETIFDFSTLATNTAPE